MTATAELQGNAAMPEGALLTRGLPVAGGWFPGRGACLKGARAADASDPGGAVEASSSETLPEAEVALAQEASDAPVLPDAGDAAASSTSLMQWMLQMVPPPPPSPVQPSGATSLGNLGRGRQTGDAQALAGSSTGTAKAFGLADADGRTFETRARGVAASMSQADRLSDTALAGSDRKSEAIAPAMPAPTGEGGALSALAGNVRSSVRSSEAGVNAAADGQVSGTAQAAAAAATAAAVTTVTVSGSPVVAPAQTWIQTPVTQPGFSDEVVVELVRRVGQAEQGTHEVMLHLNPAEMGPVSVSIELNGTAARVEFSASEALTRQHLEAALPGLAEALRDDGLSLQHGSVHEQRSDDSSAGIGFSASSAGTGADPQADSRSRGESAFDGRSGFGDRAPRPLPQGFTGATLASAETRQRAPIGPGPGRIGRLDLFA